MIVVKRILGPRCIMVTVLLFLCSCSVENDSSGAGKAEVESAITSAEVTAIAEATAGGEASSGGEASEGADVTVGAIVNTSDNTNVGNNVPELGAATPSDCVAYSESNLYKARSSTIILYPDSDWINQIENAVADTEILLEDGDYRLNKYAVVVKSGLTIRSLNGQRDGVRILGPGYAQGAEGFMVVGNDVTIADLSISDMRDHAIAVKPDLGALRDLQIYNLDIKDSGTQHIKVSPGGARNGLVACSSIGYSPGAAIGDYNGAIDLHETIDWELRDNTIYNITGDGGGCNVDAECGTYISAPAIYAWRGAQGTRIIRNTVIDSFRNIALGMGTEHKGGLIANNTIIQSSPGDAGIELFGASDVIVEGNTVQLSGDYPGAIEYRSSSNISIFNNTLSSEPWDRGNNSNIELFDNTVVP